jgi:hypothetical protein
MTIYISKLKRPRGSILILKYHSYYTKYSSNLNQKQGLDTLLFETYSHAGKYEQ